MVPPFDNSLYLPTARFARNGGVDAKDFQRLWREMEKAPASTTPYGEGTPLGAGDGITNEGPQGSRRDAADGRIGGDKVFEVKFGRKTRTQALGLCNNNLCRVANSFDVWSGGGRNAIRSWLRKISFACIKWNKAMSVARKVTVQGGTLFFLIFLPRGVFVLFS